MIRVRSGRVATLILSLLVACLGVLGSGAAPVSATGGDSFSVVATVTVGARPNDVAVSPDGSRVYVVNYYDNSVSVIATATNTVVTTVGVGSSPWGVAVSPDGSRVYVTNSEAASVSVLGASASAPAAPTSLNVTPGSGSASVSFTAGADGGASISNYEYQLNGAGSWTALSPADTSSPVTIPGLTNGTAYTVKLRAVNVAGSGAASVASSLFTPRTTPSAPTDLVATPGDGSASIAFTAGSDGGAMIMNYRYSIDDGATWLAFPEMVMSSPVTIPGLTNFTTYNVKLRAVNSAGDGVASSSVSVTPAIAGPTSCSAIALPRRRIQTCWNPFTPIEGSLIRVRTELYLAGTNTVVRACVSRQVSQTSCVFIGLERNTAYDVRVRARIRIATRKKFFTLATTQQVTTLP
jgi:YVTN family beta-propeller protein